MILYLFVFFLAFCFMLIAPQLIDVLGSLEPGPEQEEAARVAAQEAMRGKVLPAAFLAVFATGAGAYFQVLPGLRSP